MDATKKLLLDSAAGDICLGVLGSLKKDRLPHPTIFVPLDGDLTVGERLRARLLGYGYVGTVVFNAARCEVKAVPEPGVDCSILMGHALLEDLAPWLAGHLDGMDPLEKLWLLEDPRN